MFLHICVEFGKAADKSKEHDSFVKDLKEADTSMLKKYQTRAIESTISNIKILEAQGDEVVNELLNIADEQQIDTIVVGSRGLKAPKEFLLGSVSYKMTHYAKCPVIVVR
jgi:nucleotide-binding universal stress UspA family protein